MQNIVKLKITGNFVNYETMEYVKEIYDGAVFTGPMPQDFGIVNDVSEEKAKRIKPVHFCKVVQEFNREENTSFTLNNPLTETKCNYGPVVQLTIVKIDKEKNTVTFKIDNWAREIKEGMLRIQNEVEVFSEKNDPMEDLSKKLFDGIVRGDTFDLTLNKDWLVSTSNSQLLGCPTLSILEIKEIENNG